MLNFQAQFYFQKQRDFSKRITIPTPPRVIYHLPSSAYIEQYFLCKFISVYAEYTERHEGSVVGGEDSYPLRDKRRQRVLGEII